MTSYVDGYHNNTRYLLIKIDKHKFLPTLSVIACFGVPTMIANALHAPTTDDYCPTIGMSKSTELVNCWPDPELNGLSM